VFANALDMETDRKNVKEKANMLLPVVTLFLFLSLVSGSALSTSFWGLIENLCGVPAAAQTLQQYMNRLLASAREAVSPKVYILQSGFGIVQFYYLHYPFCKVKPMYPVRS